MQIKKSSAYNRKLFICNKKVLYYFSTIKNVYKRLKIVTELKHISINNLFDILKFVQTLEVAKYISQQYLLIAQTQCGFCSLPGFII